MENDKFNFTSNSEADKPIRPVLKRDDRPKVSPKEDLDYRIKGLESAKMEPGMTGADIGALDRAIVKLKEKKAEKEPKPEKDEV